MGVTSEGIAPKTSACGINERYFDAFGLYHSDRRGWIMLMRSRMTLGETVKASTALKKAIAANPTESARLAKEAQLLGVPGG